MAFTMVLTFGNAKYCHRRRRTRTLELVGASSYFYCYTINDVSQVGQLVLANFKDRWAMINAALLIAT